MSAIALDMTREVALLKFLSLARRNGWSALPHRLKARLCILRDRQALRLRLAQCKTDFGTVFVHRHGMDCDGVTHSQLCEFPADFAGFNRAVDEILAWADGPECFDILTPEKALSFDPTPSRDLHAEAHENGHSHLVLA